jgi:hypothetical protein
VGFVMDGLFKFFSSFLGESVSPGMSWNEEFLLRNSSRILTDSLYAWTTCLGWWDFNTHSVFLEVGNF